MALTVTSFDGHDINDGIVYSAWTTLDEQVFDRTVEPVQHIVPGKHPILIRTEKQGWRFPVHIIINSGDLRDKRDELNKWFRKGTTGDFTIISGDSTRSMVCTVVRVMPFDRSSSAFTVMLYAPDPRFRSGSLQCTSNGGIQFSGDLIDTTVRTAGEEGDGYAGSLNSVGIHTATTNIITNGGAETNTTGWSTGGTNVLSRATSLQKFGSACFTCVIGNSATLGTYSWTPSTSTTYSFSGWVYLDSSWTGGDVDLSIGSGFSDVTIENQIVADGTKLETWQRVACQVIAGPAATGPGNLRVHAQGSVSAFQSMRFDGMQLEALDFPTPYVETDGGTASRTDGVVKVQSSVLDDAQGWMAARVRMGMENDETGVTSHENATVFDWRVDANNRMTLFYQDSALGTDAWKFTRLMAGSDDTVSHAVGTAWGDVFTVIATWEDGRVRISVNGDTLASTVGTDIPDLSSATEWFIGSVGGTAEHLGGEVFWMAAGTGVLTQDDVETIHTQGGGGPNLLFKTEQFNSSLWTKSTSGGGAMTGNDTDDPMGGTSADTWTTPSAAGPVVYQQIAGDPVPSTDYTASLYVRAKRAVDVGVKVNLKVDDGSAGDSSQTTYTLTASWQRITHTHTFGGSPTGAPRFNLVLHPDDEGKANKISLWGAQLEQASAVTDYVSVNLGNDIPTTWPDDAGKCFEWSAYSASSTPFEFSVTNHGNTEDEKPVVRLQPLVQKAAADSWIYQREVVIANRTPNAFADYAICLTDDGAGNGWDHASAVSSGYSLSSGDDVRVFVDGVETPRWDGGGTTSSFNDVDLKLWANITLSPGLEAELNEGMTAGGPATGSDLAVVPGTTAGWPSSGALLVEDEVILYTGVTDSAFTGITRGARGTTAASHSSGETIYWVERRVQIIYGYTGASTPDARNDRKPLLDLDLSTNAFHRWQTFQSTKPRSMQWSRLLKDRTSQRDRILAPGAVKGTDLANLSFIFNNDGALSGAPNFNGWRRPIPAGTKTPSGTFISSTATVPDTMILNFWLVDGDGNEILYREQFSASGTTTATDGPTPYYSLEFEGRGAHVVTGPTSAEISDTINSTLNSSLTQDFTVPDSLGRAAYIQAVSLRLKCTAAGSVDLMVRILKYDEILGDHVPLTEESKTVVAAGSYAWVFVKFTDKVQVFPGDQLAVGFELTAKNGGATDIRWETYNQSFEGGAEVKGFRILSNSLDPNQNAVGVDDDEITVDDVGITHDADGIPYVSMLAQEDVYWLDGVLENATTGETLTLAAPISLEDVVEIDVGARTVTNTTTGESIYWSLTPSDSETWLQIVPGENPMTYTEDGAVAALVAVDWYHRWEA